MCANRTGAGNSVSAYRRPAVGISEIAQRRDRVGLFGLSVWGGMTVRPLFGDQLLQAAGFGAVWIMIALIPLAGTLIALRLPERWRPPAGDEVRSLLPRAVLAPGAALALAKLPIRLIAPAYTIG